MNSIYNNLYWLSVSAEAYYSGNSVQDGIFVSKELWDQVEQDDLGTVYYHELDGKHSEVEADTNIVMVSEVNIEQVLTEWKDSDGDYDKLYESLLDGQDETLLEEMQAFHDNFVNDIQFETVVTCKFLDKVIIFEE